jgi:hypothetical protein
VRAAGIARDLPDGCSIGPDAGEALPGGFENGGFGLGALEITHPAGHYPENTEHDWRLDRCARSPFTTSAIEGSVSSPST